MKKAWILKLIFICSFLLLSERLSTSPHFQSSPHASLHATSDHSDLIVAIELEDEVEDDALSFFCLPSTLNWKVLSVLCFSLSVTAFFAVQFSHPLPAFLRFQNLRL
jgi:hypothetical protein